MEVLFDFVSGAVQTLHASSQICPPFKHFRYNSSARTELQLLGACLDPSSEITPWQKPLILSIDMGTPVGYGKAQIADAGIAVLDTRLLSNDRLTAVDDSSAIITTRYFILGPPTTTPRWLRRPFRYGEPEYVTPSGFIDILQAILKPSDRPSRPVFLLAHDLSNDNLCLKRLTSFDLATEPAITVYLDTRRITRDLFAFRTPGLYDILKPLNLPLEGMHNSGNDALNTLKALLLLFKSYKRGEIENRRERMTWQIPEPSREETRLQDKQDAAWDHLLDVITNLAYSDDDPRGRQRAYSKQVVARSKAMEAIRKAKRPKVEKPEEPDLLNSKYIEDGFLYLLDS